MRSEAAKGALQGIMPQGEQGFEGRGPSRPSKPSRPGNRGVDARDGVLGLRGTWGSRISTELSAPAPRGTVVPAAGALGWWLGYAAAK